MSQDGFDSDFCTAISFDTLEKRTPPDDFSDGVLTAEIVHHYFPKLVELHNFPAANSYAQKIYNW